LISKSYESAKRTYSLQRIMLVAFVAIIVMFIVIYGEVNRLKYRLANAYCSGNNVVFYAGYRGRPLNKPQIYYTSYAGPGVGASVWLRVERELETGIMVKTSDKSNEVTFLSPIPSKIKSITKWRVIVEKPSVKDIQNMTIIVVQENDGVLKCIMELVDNWESMTGSP